MIRHWKKEHIDNYLVSLKEYFNECKNYSNALIYNIEDLNVDEKTYLNENLNLKEITGFEKDCVLNSILQIPEKYNFARHLITFETILLPVNNILDNKSTFIFLVDNLVKKSDEKLFFGNILLSLYKRGYESKECDLNFLKEIYKGLRTQTAFINWCNARFAYLLNDANKLEMAIGKERTLFTILSFKMKKPIGINYPNLLGIANNAVQHYREDGDILIYSMKKFGVFDEIIGQDKKGVFREKLGEYEKYKPIQDNEFLDIIKTIFPDLA